MSADQSERCTDPTCQGCSNPGCVGHRLPIRTCPVHTGTPEPCPECESKIAAGL